MTIRSWVQVWLGIDGSYERLHDDNLVLQDQLDSIQSKLNALLKEPTVVASPKLNFRPAVPTDFEGLSLQALHDLEKEAN